MKKILYIMLSFLMILAINEVNCSILGMQGKVIHIPGHPMTVNDYGDYVEHFCGPDMTNDCYVVETSWPESAGPIIQPTTEFHAFIRDNLDLPNGHGYINSEIKIPFDTGGILPVPTIYININTKTFDNYDEWISELQALYGVGT